MGRYRFEEIAINSKEKKMPTDEDQLTYIGLEHLDTGCLTISRWGSAVPLKGEKLVMRKGDVLLGKRNAYLRRAAIAPHDGIFSAHGMVLRPCEKVIDKSFFPLFIASDYFFDEAIRISVGSLSPTVNWKDLRITEFELPDLDTQKKLAEVLWAINDTMESYKRLILATDELVKSQFIEWFGEPNTDTAKWETKPFCNLTTNYDRTRRPVNEGDRRKMQGPYPYYGATGVVDYVNDYKLNGTYLLISEDGKALEYRNYDIAFIASGKIWVNNHAHVVQNTDETSLIFLQYYFKYLDISHWVTGIDQKKLNRENLDIIPIMVPPIGLVHQFDAFVKQSDKSKFELEQALSELNATYKRIISEQLG